MELKEIREVPGALRRVKSVLGRNGCPTCGKHLGGQIQYCPKCLAEDWDEALSLNQPTEKSISFSVNQTEPKTPVLSERDQAKAQVKGDIKHFLLDIIGWRKLAILITFIASILWTGRLFLTNMIINYMGADMTFAWIIALGVISFLIIFGISIYFDNRLRKSGYYAHYFKNVTYYPAMAWVLKCLFLLIPTLIVGKMIAYQSQELKRIKDYRPATYVPQGTKTWTSQEDWSSWTGFQTSTTTKAGALTLAPTNGGSGPVIAPGGSAIMLLDWTSYTTGQPNCNGWSTGSDSFTAGNTNELYSGTVFTGKNGEDVKSRGGTILPKGNIRVSWRPIRTLNNQSGSVSVKVVVSDHVTQGSYCLDIATVANSDYFLDTYSGLFTIGNFFSDGISTTVYDGGDHTKWSSLIKSDRISKGQGIMYFVRASNQPPNKDIEINSLNSLVKSGWVKLNWSGNTAGLSNIKDIQGKRYLQIAMYLYTDNVATTPSVNELTVINR